ncbi:MAG TPA: VCBS repeat-containing protein [Cyclobacteriaceae bacterium]|nr:VCBS repeat-containing protein [Cyclobacteriaceae bacterium]
MRSLYAGLMLVILLGCNRSENSTPEISDENDGMIFSLLDSTVTGINFVNEVIDGENFNILTYRNFYNGGGVAIGDINNDSLPDIYFTANQRKNKLYLNKGHFVFEDITDKAGVGGTKVWSTGVTMADVNGDGRLDIYVCNSGDVDGANRANELFINNGDLTFTERGKEYNLNNEGYGTHAAFFDYDADGDLDCYILNNSFKDPGKIELYKKVREQPEPGGDKLMRNDGGIFHDVTPEAGIYSSEIGFGLGVAVSDLNFDHLPDIYISNDFWERDYLYINKGNGKFSEELIDRINYCSVSSMGADIADLNNDGNPEIFTTDMLPADNYRLKATMAFDPYHLEDLKYRANFHYQIVQNCLHINDGTGSFQEVGLMSGVDATDWSWGALIFDFDNDGMNDIFVSNGILKDIMSMDFRDFIADTETRNSLVAKTGKFDYRDFISFIPSVPLKNYAFKNEGSFKFRNIADSIGLSQPSFSNGSAYGDLDNDGDLDLVVNNINSSSFVYRNDADKRSNNHFLKVKFKGPDKNRLGIGAEVTVRAADKIINLQNFNTRGFESSIEPSLLFGLGKLASIDELTVVWPDRKKQIIRAVRSDQTIILDYNQATEIETISSKSIAPPFEEVSERTIKSDARHTENRNNDFDQEILLPRMLSTEGPRLIVGDVNSDQLQDFILLGASGDPDKLFLQKSDGTFNFKPVSSFLADKDFESTCGALFDCDGDGDLDLMIGSGGNEIQRDRMYFIVRLYRNDGHGNFLSDPTGSPQAIGNFSTVEAEDFDKDGDVDVFLGARVVPGNYGLPPRSYLFENIDGSWIDVTAPPLADIGMVTDATWADTNGDGYKELIVVGDWMAINIFTNKKGSLADNSTIPNSKGWWNRIEPVDLDDDGDIDFVLGNWGLNTKFKATPSKPLTMFVNDFDDNGKSEFIINWYPPLDTIAYPFATKPELTTQLPGLRRTILKYKDYATKTYDSLFSPAVRANSIAYETNYLESAILWNDGKSYSLKSLPMEAQISPVFAIIVDDFDDDGRKDIWLGGNFYALKPQVGRHNASRGTLLKGTSNKGIFKYQPPKESGIFVEGEVRDAAILQSKKFEKKLFVARNNDRVLIFQKRK